MSVSSVRRLPVWVVLVAVVSLVMGMLVPVVAAQDAGAAVGSPGAAAAPASSSSLVASKAAPLLMVSSSGDQIKTTVPAAAQQKCLAKKKATKKKVKKTQTKKIYKKSLKKAQKKAKKQGKKVTKKQAKKLKKQAVKKAKKRAKKAANRAYDQCMLASRVTRIENAQWALKSSADSPGSAQKVALDAAALQGLGDEPIGRFAGQKIDGDPFDVPVRYKDVKLSNGVLQLNWLSVNGGPGKRVQDMTALQPVDRSQLGTGGTPGGIGGGKAFAYGSFVMQPKDAQTWRWSAAGGLKATVSRSGSTVKASFLGSDSAAGLQPNGQTAGMDWSQIAVRLKQLTQGSVPSRLVLWSVDQAGKTAGAVLKADDVTVAKNDTVTVSGTLAGSGDGLVPDGGQRVVSAMLETPNNSYNNPDDTKYVVITGDSIASGEGASFTGSYINPQLGVDNAGVLWFAPGGEDYLRGGYKHFCAWVDLTCKSVSVKIDPNNPVQNDITVGFDNDKGRVYEAGSYGNEIDQMACHRSKTAPGVWLARYYKMVEGQDVESINLACSGATTENILRTSFKGQPPQIDEVEDLGAYLPVTHVVNTIGANDTKILELAPLCLLAPAYAIGINPANGLSLDKLFPSALLDDTYYLDKDGKVLPGYTDGAKAVSANPYLDVNKLCSPEFRGRVAGALAAVKGKIAEVITRLHEAAPDAKIVQTTYPLLVPSQGKTYLPRQDLWRIVFEGIAADGMARVSALTGKGEPCEGVQADDYADPAKVTQKCKDTFNEQVGLERWQTYLNNTQSEPWAQKICDIEAANPPGAPLGDTPSCPDNHWAGGTALTSPKPKAPFQENLSALAGAGMGNPVNDELAWAIYGMATKVTEPQKPYAVDRPNGNGKFRVDPVITAWDDFLQYTLFLKRWLTDLLSFGALMFGFDQDWVSKEVLVGLNETVLAAVKQADPKGEFTVAVDMTQVFNGRELGSKFNTPLKPGDTPIDKAGADSTPEKAIEDTSGPDSAPGPESQRAQFVVGLFPALSADAKIAGQNTGLPVLCPYRPSDGKPDCAGDFQETIHPNWRGQAAQGQCIVAVVTGKIAGSGNACVRSLGTDDGANEVKYNPSVYDYGTTLTEGTQWSSVEGEDQLCLTDPATALAAGAKGEYLKCSSGKSADPTWDTKTWDSGKVDYKGTKVHWK